MLSCCCLRVRSAACPEQDTCNAPCLHAVDVASCVHQFRTALLQFLCKPMLIDRKFVSIFCHPALVVQVEVIGGYPRPTLKDKTFVNPELQGVAVQFHFA